MLEWAHFSGKSKGWLVTKVVPSICTFTMYLLPSVPLKCYSKSELKTWTLWSISVQHFIVLVNFWNILKSRNKRTYAIPHKNAFQSVSYCLSYIWYESSAWLCVFVHLQSAIWSRLKATWILNQPLCPLHLNIVPKCMVGINPISIPSISAKVNVLEIYSYKTIILNVFLQKAAPESCTFFAKKKKNYYKKEKVWIIHYTVALSYVFL